MKRINTKAYNVKIRRKKEGKTDYKLRLKLLSSSRLRIVVRRGLNNFTVQFVQFNDNGDKTLIGVHSTELNKLGWHGHRGNIPSAYLSGYLCGLKALKNGVREGVLDLGLARVSGKTSLFAAVKGLKDAGVIVPCSEDALPSGDVVSCKTISDYASKLSDEKYKKQFSGYLKKGVKPQELSKNFDEVKKKIKEKWQ